MPKLGFDEVIRRHLDYIQVDTNQVTALFTFYTDTNAVDTLGQPVKTSFQITTTVIFSPVRHDDAWEGQGIEQVGDAKIIVHDLESGGIDYIESEWFSRTNIKNVRILIGNLNYRVLKKAGHVFTRDKSPYHLLFLAEVHDSSG